MSIEKERPTDKPMLVVVRALNVLTCLSDNPQGLTLQRLHDKLRIPLASTHRLLGTLEAEQYVTRSAGTKRYTLGSAARQLSEVKSYNSYLVQPPLLILELGKLTGETVFLTQMVDSRIVCVSLVESIHNLRLFVRVGQEMPLHAAASARAILAYRDPALVEALLSAYPREVFTAGTPKGVNHVIDHLAHVREVGYDICDSELDDNVWAVAAPVFDAAGRVEYGVTLAAASARMESEASRKEATSLIVDTARRLSATLGHTGAALYTSNRERANEPADRIPAGGGRGPGPARRLPSRHL
ncbi:MAG: IclR family transcriptional regulator [Dermatophilaceae bacterium]